MIKKYGILSFLLFFLLSTQLKSQVVIGPLQTFNNQLNLADLTKTSVNNLSPNPLKVNMAVVVQGAENQMIFKSISNVFTLNPGFNNLHNKAELKNQEFADNQFRMILFNNRGNFPPGMYRISIQILSAKSGEELAEENFDKEVELTSPPHLVSPFDESELESQIPLFTWLPPAPVYNNQILSYRIKIVEMLDQQSPAAAISQNPSWFEKSSLRFNRLQYPVYAKELDKKRIYAWQVYAYLENIYIGKTEVWQFSFVEKKKEDEIPISYLQSYAELKRNPGQSFSLAINQLKFMFEEKYDPGILEMRIYDSKQEEVELEKSTLAKKVGYNKYIIDFSENDNLISGAFYTLEIINSKQEKYRLNFKFLRK
jgi:hypothetical protein